MYKQYDPQVLRRVQLVEKDVLQEFIRICEKHGIPYFLTGGTAIGAVRHKGFVPWDDDIDVGLLRDDYEKFLRIAPGEVGEKFEFINARINPYFPALNSNLVKKDSLHVPEEFKNCRYQYKIGMGIFPYDNVPQDARLRKKQISKAWFWGKLYFLRNIPFPHLPLKGIKAKLAHAACAVIHYALALFHIRRQFIVRQYEKAVLAYHNQTDLLTDFTDTVPEDLIVSKKDIFPLQTGEFEGLAVSLVHHNHEMLTQIFGDYMQLPPEDDRKNHFPHVLDFGDED